MTVGSGGCMLSNGIGKITTDTETVTDTTTLSIPVTRVDTTNYMRGMSGPETSYVKINFNIDSIKMASYSTCRLETSSNTQKYYINTAINILVESNLHMGDRYKCTLRIGNPNTFMYTTIHEIDSIVDSDGNLYYTLPINTKIYVGSIESPPANVKIYKTITHYPY